ncbi:DUF4232 domain-containing protein [Spirillospora sp. NPDC047418]
MQRLIWGTLAATAITTALAGCASGPTTGSTSSSGAPTPTRASTGTSAAPSPGAPAPGGGTPGAATTTRPAGSANAAGRPHCTSGMLSATLTDLGAAAGNRYATLVLTNKSGKHCTTGGWSGLQLASPDGTVPTNVVREGAPHTITIFNGGHAYERLHWGVVPAGDEPDTDRCEPVPGTLRVIPPNNTEQVATGWSFGAVCQHGRIRLQPLTTTPQPR